MIRLFSHPTKRSLEMAALDKMIHETRNEIKSSLVCLGHSSDSAECLIDRKVDEYRGLIQGVGHGGE